MQGRLDAVSVSLNGSNEEEYLRLTRPGAGGKAWEAMLDFVRQAAKFVPRVMVSIVDYDKSPQEIEAGDGRKRPTQGKGSSVSGVDMDELKNIVNKI